MQSDLENTTQKRHEKKTSPRRKQNFNALDYAVVIKAHEGYLTFSVPDFHYFKVIDMPKGQVTPEYLHKVVKSVAQCWVKTQENLSKFNAYEAKHPSPSFIKDFLKKGKYRRIGTSKAAAMLGLSRQTLRRRADSGEIKAFRTSKGTRYFFEKDILKYMEMTKPK